MKFGDKKLSSKRLGQFKNPVSASLAVIGLIAAVYVISTGIVFGTHLNKTFPNLVVAGQKAGGLEAGELQGRFNSSLQKEQITLRLGEKTKTLTAGEFGLGVDSERLQKMTQRNIFSALKPWFAADKRELPVTLKDYESAEKVLAEFKGDDFKPPQDANFTVTNDGISINDEASGYGTDTQAIADDLSARLGGLLQPTSYDLSPGELKPQITKSDIEGLSEEILSRASLEYKISAGEESVTAGKSEIASWLTVKKSNNGQPEIAINEKQIDKFVTKAKAGLETPPTDQVTSKYASGKPSQITTKGRDGTRLTNSRQIASQLKEKAEQSSPHTAEASFETAPFKKVVVTVDDQKPKRVVTYEVLRWGNTKSSFNEFASIAGQTFADERGWSAAGISFRRVASGGDFSLVIATPERVAGAAPVCDAQYSCRVGRYVIVNDDRWRGATPAWNNAGGSLRDYRHMVVNHETGHWLGFGHLNCPGAGQPAPVMQQQSISLQGCKFNPWPTLAETRLL